MALEDRGAQHDKIIVDKYHDPAADYEMTSRDYVIRPTVASAAITITLPTVTESKGRFYSITAKGSVSIALPVTIQDSDESEAWNDIALSTLNDGVLLYSDGVRWYRLYEGVGDTYMVKTEIDAEDVKTLRATPVTLVPAPGAGYINEFLSAILVLDYGSEVFTESGDNLAIKYTDDSGVAVSDTIESTGFIDQTADTITRGVPVKDAIAALSASANQILVLHNTGAAEIAGNASDDSVLTVYTTFRIINNN